jgi:diguanylate cyclase (GGDEF)-like protein
MAQILVVEDESVMNTYMALALRLEGHEVMQAHDGLEALQILERGELDLILSDMQMPSMDGLELARRLRGKPHLKNIPLIFVTGRDELETRVRGLEYAVDYIVKPFATPELLARVRAALRLHELEKELRAANARLALANKRMASVNDQLKQLVLTDELTQICNRRGFDKWLIDELWRAHRQERPLALLIFDLDHFKQVNDTWGHAQGDEVLREFARLLRNSSRHIDIVSRFGGEEFAVVLPDTDLEGAATFAEKVRVALENTDIARVTADAENLGSLRVTTSGGGAVLTETPAGKDVDELSSAMLQTADELLYTAKDAGRNRVLIREFGTDSESKPRAAASWRGVE